MASPAPDAAAADPVAVAAATEAAAELSSECSRMPVATDTLSESTRPRMAARAAGAAAAGGGGAPAAPPATGAGAGAGGAGEEEAGAISTRTSRLQARRVLVRRPKPSLPARGCGGGMYARARACVRVRRKAIGVGNAHVK